MAHQSPLIVRARPGFPTWFYRGVIAPVLGLILGLLVGVGILAYWGRFDPSVAPTRFAMLLATAGAAALGTAAAVVVLMIRADRRRLKEELRFYPDRLEHAAPSGTTQVYAYRDVNGVAMDGRPPKSALRIELRDGRSASFSTERFEIEAMHGAAAETLYLAVIARLVERVRRGEELVVLREGRNAGARVNAARLTIVSTDGERALPWANVRAVGEGEDGLRIDFAESPYTAEVTSYTTHAVYLGKLIRELAPHVVALGE